MKRQLIQLLLWSKNARVTVTIHVRSKNSIDRTKTWKILFHTILGIMRYQKESFERVELNVCKMGRIYSFSGT